jgi:ATP-dependent DNA helicase RecG
MSHILDTPIEYLKGVGPEKASILKKEANIFKFRDLLDLYPYRYVDRSKFATIQEISEANTYIQLKGTFIKIEEVGQGRAKRLTALFKDETGVVEVVWFNATKWIKEFIKPNEVYVLFDRPSVFNGKYNFTHPEIETLATYLTSGKQGYQALYNTSEKMKQRGLDSRAILKLVNQLLQTIKKEDIAEMLPVYLLNNIDWSIKLLRLYLSINLQPFKIK